MTKVLGVDLGEFSVKCCLGDGWYRPVVREELRHPQRDGMADPYASGEWETITTQALRTAVAGLSAQRVILGLHGLDTRSGYLELPRLPAAQVETAIRANASQDLGGLQGRILSSLEVPSLTPGKMGVLWAACSEQRAVSYLRVAQAAGLQVKRCEIPVLAQARAFWKNHSLLANRWYCLIDAGFRYTVISLVYNGIPYFSRDFWIAGEQFTMQAALGLGLSWEEAELKKLGSNLEERDPCFEVYFKKWLHELQRTQLFAHSTGLDFQVEGVYLTGGSAAWPGLLTRLSEYFTLPAHLESWERLHSPESGDAPLHHCSTAMGLMLGGNQ